MSQPADMNDRVTRLENEVAQVRYLAVAANQDTSNFQRVVSGQTGVLNAIGETQREHSLTLASHTRSLARLDTKVDHLSAKLDRHEAILDSHGHKFERLDARLDHHSAILDNHTETLNSHTEILGKLQVGQAHITTLLTKALDLPDEAPDTSESGE